MQTRTNDNKPGGRDLKGHSGVQPWSRGDIFPCIIARREFYLAGECFHQRWELSAPGAASRIFTTYDGAHADALRHLGRAA